MSELLNDIRTNWSSLEPVKKVYFVVGFTVLVLLCIYIVGKLPSSEFDAEKTDIELRVEEIEAEGVSFLDDEEEGEIFRNFSKSKVALKFSEIEEGVSSKFGEIDIAQKKIMGKLDELSLGLSSLKERDSFLETQITSESAQRKAVYARISSANDGDQAPMRQGVPVTQQLDSTDEVEYISAFDFLTLNEFEAMPNMAVSDVAAVDDEGAVKIQTVAEIEKEIEEFSGDKSRNSRVVPAGTIFKAKLLAGVDTPTFSGAEESAFPALAVIVGEALAPNGRSYDYSGCHVLVGGYGSLSTERAYFRTQNLSCISNDGEILESDSMNAFATGIDGKAGLNGTVVTKDSSIIAKAIAASMWESIGSAISPQSNLADQITTNDPYQLPSASYTARNTLGRGLSESGSLLTERYLDIAKNIFPVIEIQAGRVIEFVVENRFTVSEVTDNEEEDSDVE